MISSNKSATVAPLTSLFTLLLFISCQRNEPSPTSPPNAADTTGHNYVWTQYLLGGAASSSLFDVAIINDESAIAVGEIYVYDSTGVVEPDPYNAARWDGSTWHLEKIPTVAYGGFHGADPLVTVFAFSESDIWTFSRFGATSHWNGQTWETQLMTAFSGGGIRFWGTSSQSLYLVGTNGSISWFNGKYWQQLSSGTTLDIEDIWGAPIYNYLGQAVGTQILAIATGASPDQGRRLLKIDGLNVSTLADTGLSWEVNSVWFGPFSRYYIVGAGIFQKNSLNDPLWTTFPSGVVTSYASSLVRGDAPNSVFVVGSFMEVAHFNGSTWYIYRNEIPFGNGALGGLVVRGNLVITVGQLNNAGVALVGRRD